MIEALIGHGAAYYQHLINALFNGLFPVLTISLLISSAFILLRREFRFAIIGVLFSSVGAVVGLLIGASREPAVQALLPAIIVLITGYLGWTLREEAHGQRTVLRAMLDKNTPESEIDIRLVTSLVYAAILGLMLSTAFGAMWGASLRLAADRNDRRYEVWRLNYEMQEMPIRTELLRRQLALPPTTEE